MIKPGVHRDKSQSHEYILHVHPYIGMPISKYIMTRAYIRAACRALYAMGRQFEACHSIWHSIKYAEDIFFKNDRRDTVISACRHCFIPATRFRSRGFSHMYFNKKNIFLSNLVKNAIKNNLEETS